MKKLILSFCSFLFLAGITTAQDANEAFKEGQKIYRKYQTELDDSKKRDLIDEAASHLDVATNGASAFEGKNLTKMWLLAGQVYNEIAGMDIKTMALNPDFNPKRPGAALQAYNAFKTVLEVADKKYFKSDALEALRATSAHLSNAGLFSFKAEKYEDAYQSYKAVSDLNALFETNGKKPVLDEEAKVLDHKYMMGLSAYQSKHPEEAEKLFTELKNKEYNDAGVYNALINISLEKKDNDKAEALLTEARQKFPQDQAIMVTELNHYLSTNRFDELVGKLEKAIAADPENVSYYSALGNTYDNLFQREMEAKNLTKADEYFGKALEYYGKALEKDDTYFFAIYNTGVLFVNKANLLIEELKVMEDKGDYSKAALREMEVKKSKINEEFEKSLPYFKRAESINPSDLNTLSALKEIFARKEDFELSKKFAERMKVVQDGGTIEEPYFNE